jgi:hypothetical protein
MLWIIDEYIIVIQDIILNKIMPYFKTYFSFLIGDKVEKITNRIEKYIS